PYLLSGGHRLPPTDTGIAPGIPAIRHPKRWRLRTKVLTALSAGTRRVPPSNARAGTLPSEG
ncbi:MAG TPA: hypothetical protein VFA63_15095, partial [Pseudonocardiaceae bacterium]|nr:hypothetical protein [Pseudonocardiaceae bacterium]